MTACGQPATIDSGADNNGDDVTTGDNNENLDSGDEPSSDDPRSAITEILESKPMTFQVQYEITGQGETSQMSMYMKGKNVRYDSTVDGQTGSIFFMDNKVYSCSGSPVSCIEFGEAQESSTISERLETDMKQNFQDYKFVLKSSRTIAGTKAKCFGITFQGVESEMCYSKEGIPLYAKTSYDGEANEMTAKQYSTNVPDSLFELPVEPQDINALMQQYQ